MQSNVNLKRVLEFRQEVHAYISSQTGLDFYDSEIKNIGIIINRQDQRKECLAILSMIKLKTSE